MKWAKEIKMFTAEKGLDTVLQDIISVEDKLQVAFLSKSKHQTQIKLILISNLCKRASWY